jgi:predicted DCC family thiol-disulfide oxidoreductase YuxK
MEKPILQYDGQCSFCVFWIERWKKIIGEKIEYEPAEEIESVRLILPGETLEGAGAVFKALTFSGRNGFWRLYKNLPGFRPISEFAYRFIANHRNFFYKITLFFYRKR